MRKINLNNTLIGLGLLILLGLGACQTSTGTTAGTGTQLNIPQRVDIRGSIVSTRYSDGQIMVEVENYSPSPDSRYDRAFVLVQPVAQLFGPDGQSISINELRQGQQVAILLRGGGRGNRIGVGMARKLWVLERF